MNSGPAGNEMTHSTDWRAAAKAEYRQKRAELAKKVEATRRAEQKAAERRVEAERELEELDIGARAFGLDGVAEADKSATSGPTGVTPVSVQIHPASDTEDGPSAREIILEALEEAYPNSLTAAELKKIIEARVGREIHYKTPGMSLYRLSKTHQVRRRGENWFLVKSGNDLSDSFDDLVQLTTAYDPEDLA